MTGNVPVMTTVTRLQPAGLPQNPAFSQGVAVAGPVRTIYVGGQNGEGEDVGAQTRAALRNVELVLREAGAELTDVVHWRIAVVHGVSLLDGFTASQEVWAGRGEPPAISVDVVAGLASPAFLVEITATAVVPA
jgi:enamine deaminase RidA (YjgF/YER057c/UK114 family)